jgi:hypothetical protein
LMSWILKNFLKKVFIFYLINFFMKPRELSFPIFVYLSMY